MGPGWPGTSFAYRVADDGCIFDLMNIVPFLKKFGRHPVTGEKLDAKSLTRLNFHKNGAGKFHCPVMFNVFNKNSHIVAVKTTGNVYSREAVDELNISGRNGVRLEEWREGGEEGTCRGSSRQGTERPTYF